jgi:hypothetical protein
MPLGLSAQTYNGTIVSASRFRVDGLWVHYHQTINIVAGGEVTYRLKELSQICFFKGLSLFLCTIT